MKLKPREKRERLFKKSRPLIRPVQFYDGDQYHNDIKIMWVAHSKNQWDAMPEGINQSEFVEQLMQFSNRSGLYIADDDNNSYKNGIGPVGVCQIFDHGWKVEPHVHFFPWATPRNILRSTVSFLHMMKYKKIGVCVVCALKSSVPLFDKCTEYGVLFRSGMIAGGDPRGDEYIYSIRGKRQ